MEKQWWKKAVIYQVYPRSFQDTNGDGIGDIPGIIKRLDYLEDLGVDAIWLSPVYQSPQDDNRYDISDYQDIYPPFGTIQNMEELIVEAQKRHIGIIMDLVLNHSSDEHFWFQEAKKSRNNPYHDYYVWRDGEEGCPPNDMQSGFGGSAWEWVPELRQYYFHQFSIKQPDLNWYNPALRQELYDVVNWWIDKGVAGFRLDVIDQIAKDPDTGSITDNPNLHPFIKELSRNTFGKVDLNLVSVGETWSATPENAPLFSNPDGSELSMVFQFEHMVLDQQGRVKWDLTPLPFIQLKQTLSTWQTALHGKAWNSLFWDNHDLPRIVSRWGDEGEYRVISAKMFATLLHGMEGTPYIYQGEELGMTNIRLPIEGYRDLETRNIYRFRMKQGYPEEEIMRSIYAQSRDNARTPMQWDDSAQAGFTTGEPWIAVNPNYKQINAAAQVRDEHSVYSYYKKLIRLRKEIPVIVDGVYELLLAEDPSVFAYTRTNDTQKLIVICNFYGQECEIDIPALVPEGSELLLANYEDEGTMNQFRPYEARMYLFPITV
ncbi:MAG: alpha-glucosidase [Clostridiales bacterium]|nr:alpha-glucosidase [Clostridiales bacterium]